MEVMNPRSWLLMIGTGCISAKYAELAAPEDSGATPITPKWELTQSPPSVCENPTTEPTFVEQGLALGLEEDHIDTDAPQGHVDGPSLALADIEGDGHLELAVLRMENGDSILYRGIESGFAAHPGTVYPGRAGLFADADEDGDLDLLVGGLTPVWLSFNPGGTWEQEAWPALDPPEEQETRSLVHDLSLGDFDLDGHDDVYVVRTAVPFGDGVARNDRVLRLGSDGLRIDRSLVPEEVGLRHGFDAITFDEDGDGDLDTYLVHDHGATVGPSTLLSNNGGQFEDAADTCFCSLQVSAKGVDLADINGDGQPELLVTGAPLNHLLSRDETGWIDISDTSGIREGVSTAAGWGGTFLDIDNDGARDILLVQGDRWNPGEVILPDGTEARFDEPIHLLRQTDGQFQDVASSLGLSAEGSFRAVLAADLNKDGVQDMLITQVSGRTLAYMSTGCTQANWIAVDAPIGAKVTVYAGEAQHTDWSRVSRGYQSTARIPLHFGLGQEAQVDEVTVDFPGGTSQTFSGHFPARQTLTISRL